MIQRLLCSVLCISTMHSISAYEEPAEEPNVFSSSFLKTVATSPTHTASSATPSRISTIQEDARPEAPSEQQGTRRERWYRYVTMAATLYALYHLYQAWHDTAYVVGDNTSYLTPALFHAWSKKCAFCMHCLAIVCKTALYRAGARVCVWCITISWNDIGNLIFHPLSETTSIVCC